MARCTGRPVVASRLISLAAILICACGSSSPSVPPDSCAAGSWDSDANPSTACLTHSTCAPGTFVEAQGTATTNTVCRPCPSGTFSITSNAASCAVWSDCAAGQFVDAPAASATHDRSCTACAADTYSYAVNAPSCAPASCGNGHLEAGEVCEGTSSASCQSFGFRGGVTRCTSCAVDPSTCTDPEITDIAFEDTNLASLNVCALDRSGALRCTEQLNGLAAAQPGPYVSIASGLDELCAMHPDGAITCWSELQAQPEELPALAGTGASFLEDDGEAVYLPSADGQSTFLKLSDETHFRQYTNATSLDLWVTARSGNSASAWLLCATFVDGSLRCYDSVWGTQSGNAYDLESASPRLVIDLGGPFIDVAVGNDELCGIRGTDHAVTCWKTSSTGIDPAPVTALVPEHAQAIWGAGGKLLVQTAPGVVQVVASSTLGSSDPLPDGVRAVTINPFPTDASDYGALCWVTGDGHVDCDDHFAALARAPATGTFSDVVMAPRNTMWLDTAGRVYVSELSSRADLSLADHWVAASGHSAFCGLHSGEVVCTGGSHYEEIPAGPYQKFALASPLASTRPFCGLRTDGTLTCTSLGHVIDDVPSGTFIDVDVEADPSYANSNRQWAVAIRADGSLVCWGSSTPTDPCANLPVGTGFVHVELDATQGKAQRSTGTVVVWTPSSTSVTNGPVPVTYSGVYGLMASGKAVRWDGLAAGFSPSTSYVQLVVDVAQVHGSDPSRAADACGLTASGTVECWQDTGSGATTIAALPGTYSAIAGGNGSLWLRDATSGLTYVMGNFFLPDVAVNAVAASALSLCWLEKPTGALGCAGNAGFVSSSSYPNGTAFDRLVGEHAFNYGDEAYCGFTSSGGQCWGNGELGPLGTTSYTAVSTYPGSFVCGIQASDGSVTCSGTDPYSPYTPTAAPASQASLPSLDVASNYGTTCRIRSDGELDCWGSPFANTALPTGPFRQVVSSGAEFLALRTDGTVAGFDSALQTPLPSLPGGSYSRIEADYDAQCGVTTSGAASCFGGDYPLLRSW